MQPYGPGHGGWLTTRTASVGAPARRMAAAAWPSTCSTADFSRGHWLILSSRRSPGAPAPGPCRPLQIGLLRVRPSGSARMPAVLPPPGMSARMALATSCTQVGTASGRRYSGRPCGRTLPSADSGKPSTVVEKCARFSVVWMTWEAPRSTRTEQRQSSAIACDRTASSVPRAAAAICQCARSIFERAAYSSPSARLRSATRARTIAATSARMLMTCTHRADGHGPAAYLRCGRMRTS